MKFLLLNMLLKNFQREMSQRGCWLYGLEVQQQSLGGREKLEYLYLMCGNESHRRE